MKRIKHERTKKELGFIINYLNGVAFEELYKRPSRKKRWSYEAIENYLLENKYEDICTSGNGFNFSVYAVKDDVLRIETKENIYYIKDFKGAKSEIENYYNEIAEQTEDGFFEFIKRFEYMGDKLMFIYNYDTQLENYEAYKEFNKLLNGLNDELKLYIELERPELLRTDISWFNNELIELKKIIKEQGGDVCENY